MTIQEAFSQKTILANQILDKMYNTKWDDLERREKAIKDVEWTIIYALQSFKLRNQLILENYYSWMVALFKRLNFELFHLDLLFKETKDHLSEVVDKEIAVFFDTLNLSKEYSDETMKDNKHNLEMLTFRDFILDAKKNEAKEYVNMLLENGLSIEDVYIYVFQESLRSVGQLWLDGEITVAMEHYYTAMTQYIMSTLYDKIFQSNPTDKKILACSVGSELHEVGIRMVADIFELKGWNTRYLGANVPLDDLISDAADFNPNIIALSVTMPYHIVNLENMIANLKKHPTTKDVTIMVGGRPFADNPDLCKQIGADIYALDALDGVRVANELIK